MKIERVVVTGGRNFTDAARIEADLRALLPLGLIRVAQGAADGAGPRRNIRMLEAEGPDLVLAYPDPTSRGTWHCVCEAVRRDIAVAVWLGEHSQNLLSWERDAAAANRVAHDMRMAGLSPPTMTFWEGEARRVVVLRPLAQLNAGALLEVLGG